MYVKKRRPGYKAKPLAQRNATPHRGSIVLVPGTRVQLLAAINLGSASSIVHFIVGGTNTLLNALS